MDIKNDLPSLIVTSAVQIFASSKKKIKASTEIKLMTSTMPGQAF